MFGFRLSISVLILFPLLGMTSLHRAVSNSSNAEQEGGFIILLCVFFYEKKENAIKNNVLCVQN